MSIWDPLVSGVLSFVAGFVASKISVNADYDRERCAAVITAIDNIVIVFHERFSGGNETANANGKIFDYQVRGLVDDTTLLPIIGRRCFDAEYTETLGEIYKLSLDSPLNMPQNKKLALMEKMNTHALNLKKIININKKDFRLFNRV